MKDRYLFKAKRIDNGEWVQGALLDGENHCIIGQEIKFSPYVEHECKIAGYEVDRNTICQCTGLKDKNGKLIWENDVVKDLFSDDCAPIKYGSYQSCFDSTITKTEHVGFYADWTGRYAKRYRKDLGYWINMVDAEIVGNIFDNPELFEV
uniref:YopX protein n=1 Tax=Siphoviridae sp. ct7EW56 TaxID=2827562 RepID=A0A8S5LRQ9_9CAUD|nr:MAG TPA: YopX protein [Siphoviridae sp. ct7EW56]